MVDAKIGTRTHAAHAARNSESDIQDGPLARCPRSGWTYQDLVTLNCYTVWLTTETKDDPVKRLGHIPVPNHPEIVRLLLLMATFQAIGTTSVNIPPSPIPVDLWNDLELFAIRIHDEYEYHARAPSGEKYFRLRFFPRNHFRLKYSEPYQRARFGKDATDTSYIRQAFDELTSLHPDLAHLERPESAQPWARWVEHVRARAMQNSLEDGHERDISLRNVEELVAKPRTSKDAIREYLRSTGKIS